MVNTGDVRKQVPSGGWQLADDLVWHLPVAELPDAPRLGDVILDGIGRRWTILAVKLATLGVRWRCETRDVAIAAGLDDAISVQKNAGDSASPICGHGRPAFAREFSHRNDDRRERRIALHETRCESSSRRTSTWTYVSHPRRGWNRVHDINSTGADQIGQLQVVEVESSG